VGRGLLLGRVESTLTQPELQEQVCLQTPERRVKKKKTNPNHKALQIPATSSNPERKVQFQAIKEARKRYCDSIK